MTMRWIGGVQGYSFYNFSTHMLQEQGATHSLLKSLLISAFQGHVHYLSISLILTKYFDLHFLSDGEDLAAGLGQDVNTPATSYVTLVFGDGHSSTQKVIREFSNAWT